MEKTMRNNITDSELLQWAEIGVQSFIGRIRPALDKRIAEEAVRYHRDRAVSKVLDTAAKARRNANQ